MSNIKITMNGDKNLIAYGTEEKVNYTDFAEIKRRTSRVSRIELLAEEAAELAAAASKYARILRDENPTQVNEETAWKMLLEEYSDVIGVARTLMIEPSYPLIYEKYHRWVKRLEDWKEVK